MPVPSILQPFTEKAQAMNYANKPGRKEHLLVSARRLEPVVLVAFILLLTLGCQTRHAKTQDEAPRDTVETIDLLIGEARDLDFEAPNRLEIVDSSIADVVITARRVTIIAQQAGSTKLIKWHGDGSKKEIRLRVDERMFADRPIPVDLQVGQRIDMDFDTVSRAAVADPEIVDISVVRSSVLIHGLREGKTSLLVWDGTGSRMTMIVTVR